MCADCLDCRDPDIYCKFRESCTIWFLTKKNFDDEVMDKKWVNTDEGIKLEEKPCWAVKLTAADSGMNAGYNAYAWLDMKSRQDFT